MKVEQEATNNDLNPLGLKNIEIVYCACGCGFPRLKYDTRGREYRFINGHKPKKQSNIIPEFIKCLCGCGKTITRIDKYKKIRKYVRGHSSRIHPINSVEFIYCACGCGKTRNKTDRKGQYFNFIENHHNRGKHNTAWKGGRTTHYAGYVQIWKPDHKFADHHGYVMEHRLIWEEHNKACLLPWGHIHHINHIKNDNDIKNLQGMTNSQHSRLHWRNRKQILENKIER